MGDFVVLGTGESGTVLDISIRSTQILTRDGVTVTVPNSVLNSARVLNESSPRDHKRIRLPVSVAYGTDAEVVDDALLTAARGAENVVETPRPRVRFAGFGDSALDFELFAWVEDPTHELWAEDELNRAVYEELQTRGVEIPFPQREIEVETAAEPRADGRTRSQDGRTRSRDGRGATENEVTDRAPPENEATDRVADRRPPSGDSER
jgi:small-conductance mechanosensitive channel